MPTELQSWKYYSCRCNSTFCLNFHQGSGDEEQVLLEMFKEKWPIYQRRKTGYLVQDLVRRLVFSKIDDSSICSSVPYKCQENANFLLNVNSLASAWDLVVYGNGTLGSSSCVTTLVKCSEEGTANIVGKNCKTFDYNVKRNYYKHQYKTSFHPSCYVHLTRKRWHLIPNGIDAVLFWWWSGTCLGPATW